MVIVFGLILYIVTPATEGNMTRSVFIAGFWYSYGCSLFCEYHCIMLVNVCTTATVQLLIQ